MGTSLPRKPGMKLRRLARMTVSELLERAGWATPSALRADVSLAKWQTVAPARFFPGATVAAPSLLAGRWPAAHKDIMRSAEQISLKRFDLLGYRDLSFGEPVDWQLDPLAGR